MVVSGKEIGRGGMKEVGEGGWWMEYEGIKHSGQFQKIYFENLVMF